MGDHQLKFDHQGQVRFDKLGQFAAQAEIQRMHAPINQPAVHDLDFWTPDRNRTTLGIDPFNPQLDNVGARKRELSLGGFKKEYVPSYGVSLDSSRDAAERAFCYRKNKL